MMQSTLSKQVRQGGSALLFCIIMLVALSYLAISSVNTGVMQVRMASSLEEQMNAFQTASAGIDYAISDTSNLPTSGTLNTPSTVTLSPNSAIGDTFYAATGEIITVTAERKTDCGLPPRTSKSSSLLAFSSFEYKIKSDINKIASKRGRSHQRQGYIVLGPKC